MMPKTIAFCLFKYFAHGGLQRDMMRIAMACQQGGASIRVYTMQWEGPQPPGFDVRLVPTHGLSNHGRASRFARRVQQLLQVDPVATVAGFNRMPGLDIYFGSDVCLAESLRGRHPVYQLTPRCRSMLKMEQAVFQRESQTHILLISPKQVSDYKKHYGLADDRYTLLPPGLDDNFGLTEDATEARRRVRAEFGVADDDFLLLLVGSAFKTKGVDRALRAVAALSEPLRKRCRFAVVGQGNESPYRRLAKRLGIAARFQLLGARSDIAALMVGADILLHPARVENTGLVLLEALASGLPVICTQTCGYASYVRESGGGVVLPEPFEQRTLALALEGMLDADALAKHHSAMTAYCRRTPLGGLVERASELILERLP